MQLAQYLSAAITVHALLLSLGGLLAVNTLRALSQLEEEAWRAHEQRIEKIADEIRRERYPDASMDERITKVKLEDLGAFQDKFPILGTSIPRIMIANVLLGAAGTLFALLILTFLSDSAPPLSGYLFFLSWTLIVTQLGLFLYLAIGSMQALTKVLHKSREWDWSRVRVARVPKDRKAQTP